MFDLLKKDNFKSNSNVLKASTSVHWRWELERAVETLLTAITSPPLLSYPDFDQLFKLHVYARNKVLGAGLYQYKDIKLRILIHCSRAFARTK